MPARTLPPGTLPPEAAARLRDFKRAAERAVPGVERVILFGSRARGDAREDSDYDIAVVVRDLADRSAVRRVLSDITYDHIVDGFYFSAILLPGGYLTDKGGRATELAEDINRDGIEIA